MLPVIEYVDRYPIERESLDAEFLHLVRVHAPLQPVRKQDPLLKLEIGQPHLHFPLLLIRSRERAAKIT